MYHIVVGNQKIFEQWRGRIVFITLIIHRESDFEEFATTNIYINIYTYVYEH